MFKNVKIKRILKKYIFPVLTLVNKIVPKDDSIIFLYSANKGVQHNLLPLRDFLIENNYDKKYKIVCGIESIKYRDNGYNVKYIGRIHSIFYFHIHISLPPNM